ncbi:MAG: hypothetical protein QOJ80_6931 [Mycobacterium sp.]|jgi:hypothetical protein|nr:hypothetical protein [Mycobacterium sp.]
MPDDLDDEQPTCEPTPPGGPPPPPFQYHGQSVTPVLDPGAQQWGFSFHGKWIPLSEPGC